MMPGSAGVPAPPPPINRAVVPAETLSRVQPTFPRAAVMAGVTGSVTVQVSINEQGGVVEAHAVSGPPLLRDAAVAAARRWKFKPSTVGGVPAKTTRTIQFNFKGDR